MLKFYYSGAPNPTKVALMLEETGLEYDPIPVDTRLGQQHEPAFLALNPNAKVPVIVDGDTVVFDSNAIVLYLGEKTGQFMPPASGRGEMLSWMMFVASGVGPYSGQAVHFQHHAPEKLPYAINRYVFEAERHFGILDRRLGEQRFMLGEEYGIVDMALWGWPRMIPMVLGEKGFEQFPHVKRFTDEVSSRPAAQRAAALKDRHAFKTEMDDEARRAMFPGNERL